MADFDGVWDTVTRTPMGDQKAELTLGSDSGSLTGTSAGPMGTLALENGRIAGDRATWTMNMTVPFPMTLSADVTVTGDSLSGTIQAGAFGSSPITGTRRD